MNFELILFDCIWSIKFTNVIRDDDEIKQSPRGNNRKQNESNRKNYYAFEVGQ